MQGLPLRLVLGFAAATVFALGAILLLPGEGTGPRPAESTLVAVALVVAAVMGAAIFVGVRFELGLPVSIAVYAANGLLLGVLVWLLLGGEGAPAPTRVLALTLVAAAFAGGALALARRPHEVVLGYKG